MAVKTNIGWTDRTWSPWLGCRKVSEGCANCYIVTTTPFRTRKLLHGGERVELSVAYWKQPLRWNRQAERDGVRIKVFPSLCDWLDDEVPVAWLATFLELIHRTPNLDWQLLTKRPLNFFRRLDAARGKLCNVGSISKDCADEMVRAWLKGEPPANVLVGVSVENQRRADERRELFRGIPAERYFVSYEPALDRVDWTGWEWVHQIISGGESGEGARPTHPAWHRATRDFCAAHAIAFFFKQWGAWQPFHQGTAYMGGFKETRVLKDGEGATGWPVYLVGKVRAGRLLDGCTHDEGPLLKESPCEWHRGEILLRADEDRGCPECGAVYHTSDCPACGDVFVDWRCRGYDDVFAGPYATASGDLRCTRCGPPADKEQEDGRADEFDGWEEPY